MTKDDYLKNLNISVGPGKTVFINGKKLFDFTYTALPPTCDAQLISKYRYFGGLQCNLEEGSPDYKVLEGWLCDIAEMILKFTKQ